SFHQILPGQGRQRRIEGNRACLQRAGQDGMMRMDRPVRGRFHRDRHEMDSMALAAPGGELSIWALFWQAGWVVKLVMIGLLAASIWSWAIIIDKIVAFGRMRAALNRFEQVFWSGQSLEDLYRTLAERKTTGMGSIFVAA